MPAFISVPLTSLFVFLAAFNVWIMLSGRSSTPGSRRLWNQIHRACGYIFIALFVIFFYFMLLRIRSADELSPRIVLHVSLALILAPLLLAKVIAVRYQKSAWNVLVALGIAIFAIAFTLVSMNVAVHYLRNLPPHKIPFAVSLRVIAAVLTCAVIAFFARSKKSSPKAGASTLAAGKPVSQQPSNLSETLNLTLARIEAQTHDAKTLRFLLPADQPITARPGQFLAFDWMIDGKPVKRSYTICSSPTQRNFVEITAKRVDNGYVSKFLNDRASVGLTVKARGPYGKFHFEESKHQRIVLIAAGSGITPMMAMLRYIDDLCLKVKVTLIYCVRTKRDVIFENDLTAMEKRLDWFRKVVVLSQPNSDSEGWKGRLRREILEREVETPLDSTFFLCGPPLFMELGRALLKEMGVEASRVLQESFGGGVSAEKIPVGAAGPLEIKLSRSGLTITSLRARACSKVQKGTVC